MIYIGIDPGLKGGVAAYREHDQTWVEMRMPKKDAIPTLIKWINPWWKDEDEKVLVAIERVHAMPGNGVTGMFTFGLGYGKIIGMLEALGIRYLNPTPQEWMKRLGLKKAHKSDKPSVAYVTEHHPSVNLIQPRCTKPHDGIADAVCLCEYAMKVGGKA